MNRTWPGRAHIIINREQIYLSLWLGRRRFHFHTHRVETLK